MSDIDTSMPDLRSGKRVLSDSELDVVVGGIMIIGGAQERGYIIDGGAQQRGFVINWTVSSCSNNL
jgi:hypothetical protein